MYVQSDYDSVEPRCYDNSHIQEVVSVIKSNFDATFERFIETGAGTGISMADFMALQEKFGVSKEYAKKQNKKNISDCYKSIIRESVENFENDRKSYFKIMDENRLRDLDEDAYLLKSKILKTECPIIRKTLANKKAKELDKYRAAYKACDADHLLIVTLNLCIFGKQYAADYNKDIYESISDYRDLKLELLDTSDDHVEYGVIGGGIKSHMLYKIYPGLFPNRSRGAVWALWYLTDKKDFGCITDSEFLMIDVKKSITQQNYFYPYQLFSYYALELYKMLKEKAEKLNAYIDPEYRYVIVDEFLNFIADEHESQIAEFRSQIREDRGW